MRVSELRAGMRCNWNGHEMYYIERVPARGRGGYVSLFRCPDFAGQNGPDDKGLVEFSDRHLKEVRSGSGT